MSYPFLIKGKSLLVGVSVGHAFNDGRGHLLERADRAMYQAKNSLTGVVSATAL
jgi:GGDEF domain-containing protein